MEQVDISPSPARKPSQMRYVILCVFGVLLAGAAINHVLTNTELAAMNFHPPSPDALQREPARVSERPVVTKADYDALETGIGYYKAVSLIGTMGDERSRSEFAETSTVMYSWQNRDGSNMIATFQNDKLVSKAQAGLR